MLLSRLSLFFCSTLVILSVAAPSSTTSKDSTTTTSSKNPPTTTSSKDPSTTTSSNNPPTTTSSKSTSSTSSASTSGNSPTSTPGKKRGLAFSAGDTPGDLNNANQTNSLITWQYDWGSSPPGYIIDSHIEYVPMQWGSANVDQFAASVKSQGAKTILAFNEPDSGNEANMQAKDAASLWIQFLEPMKASGVRLGGPAVTAPGTGIPWLIDFFSNCTSCSVDFIPLHWYGDGLESFYQYIWAIHSQFPSKPIWVTEFACTSTNETAVADFLNQSITYLDSLDWIERYSWFGFFRPRPGAQTSLLDKDGALTGLGQIYIGAKTVHTQVITQAPSQTFKTVSGADNPTQGLVTTYAGVNASSRRWTILGGEMLSLGVALAGTFIGAIWTIL